MNYRPYLGFILLGVLGLALSRQPIVHSLRRPILWLSQPVLASETTTTHHVVNFLTIIASLRDLARDNANLAAKNNELQAQLSALKEVQHENAILHQELKFIQESADTYIPAQLIGRTPSGAIKDAIINRGKRHGVSAGQAVIAQGYLIGVVSQTDERQSTILLLTHPRSIVPALLQDSRATGLLRGGIGGLALTDLLIDASVKQGETVITSGLGGTLPPGLPIGSVSSVTERKGDITKKATVTSPVDSAKLEMVFIRQTK